MISTDELVYMKAEDVCRLHNIEISVDGEKCELEAPELLTVDHGLPEFGLNWQWDDTSPLTYVI